ncbi:MAG: NADH:ubiquinone oxidoreductase subunit J [Alphaproteobacteria bacterium]|nr:MAG: NADH:ubiquinone oxidoreductase subunit J [Alphaproteobacteria bacterium]
MNLFFFLFSSITVLSAIAVISSRNPVHSVLFLILAFVNSAGLFVLAGAEFLAMILLIVYVGAVAVLFLFVVMMLNINLEEIKNQVKKYFYSGLFVGLVLMAELFFSFSNLDLIRNKNIEVINNENLTNTHLIGSVMYTEYFFVFQLSGCILLVAMVGAIVLTLRRREGVLRQDISKQVSRKKKDSIELIKVKNDNAN